jgi:hypothetical protein
VATPPNRKDLRRMVERKIMSWFEVQTQVNFASGYAAGATSIVVDDATDIRARMVLEIGDELLRVKSVSSNTLTVVRGDQQTTPAAISDDAVVNVWPYWGWSDAEKNDAINEAIDFLYPDIWYPKTVANTVEADAKEFGLPEGVTLTGEYIYEVELKNDNDDYQPIYCWRIRNDSLIFDVRTDVARDIRLQLCGRQPQLTSDTDQLKTKLPEGVPAIIAEYGAKVLLENLLGNRTRYTEYSASLNDRASTPDELQRQIYYFYNQAVLAKDKAFRPRPSIFATVRRNR